MSNPINISGQIKELVIEDENSPKLHYSKGDVNAEFMYQISLDELMSNFWDCHKSIFQYDTSESIALIPEGSNIVLSINKYKKGDNIKFVKLKHKRFGEIIISTQHNHYIKENIEWSQYGQIMPDATIDTVTDCKFDGYEQNIEFLKNIGQNDINDFPALMYCNDLKIQNGKTLYQGYVPSISQLNIIITYIDLLNYVFDYIGIGHLPVNEDAWWSISEINQYHMWILADYDLEMAKLPGTPFNDKKYAYYTKIGSKTMKRNCLPLFKEI